MEIVFRQLDFHDLVERSPATTLALLRMMHEIGADPFNTST